MDIRPLASNTTKSTERKASAPPQDQVVSVKASPESGPKDEVALSGPIQPESGVVYQANQSLPRSISLSFDDKAIAFFHNGGLKFDLEQANIVTQDGRRVPFDHRAPAQATPRDQYAVSEGYKLPSTAEPWQFRIPGIPSQVFGKPYGVRVEGAEQGLSLKFLDAEGEIIDRDSPESQLDDSQGMRVDTKVFRRNRTATLGQLAMHKPAEGAEGPANLPFADDSLGGVSFLAPTESTLNTVKSTFEKLFGGIIDERTTSFDLAKLEAYDEKVQELIQEKLEAGGDVDGQAVMLEGMEDPKAYQGLQQIYGPGAESLSKAELLNGVTLKAMKASPLEITVIPRGKTALDCVIDPSENTQHQLKNVGRAYFLRTNPMTNRVLTGAKDLPPHRLFVGEEILESEKGVKAVLMHELLHVFEHLLATPEENQQIESSFQQATEFQSLYGANRDEYLTTVGEEFLGTHGADGPKWVEKNHPGVFNLLSDLTSKDQESL